MTLEEILKKEKRKRSARNIGYDFKIADQKDCILEVRDFLGKDFFTQLKEMLEEREKTPCFDDSNILACWELINKKI